MLHLCLDHKTAVLIADTVSNVLPRNKIPEKIASDIEEASKSPEKGTTRAIGPKEHDMIEIGPAGIEVKRREGMKGIDPKRENTMVIGLMGEEKNRRDLEREQVKGVVLVKEVLIEARWIRSTDGKNLKLNNK